MFPEAKNHSQQKYEAYKGDCQTSMMELFAKIVHSC